MEQNQAPKSKITPSYAKKDESKKNNKRTLIFKSKVTAILVTLVLVAIIVVATLIIYNFIQTKKYKKYENYESKMDIYGFSRMYNNTSSKSSDKVTKSEAIKMIISTVFNVYDISSFAPIENPEYDNQIWVNYAKSKDLLIEDINIDNEDKKISYIDVITILSKAKVNLLELNLDIEGTPKFSDINKYTNEQQTVLKDMVWNKIIENNSIKLNANRNISKGELNQLLINFSEKYRTLTLSRDDKFIINEEKLPYNYEQYPYVLANVSKEAYEIKFHIVDATKSKTPVELYAEEKQNHSNIESIIRLYFKTILNVNYETINFAEFKSNINSVSMYEYSDEQIQDYINYVKENKIIISGTPSIQMPIIYYDGRQIRVRVAVEYNVSQSNLLENLIFSDRLTGNIYEYSLGNDVKYIDVPFERDNSTGNLYISIGSINKNISGNITRY